MGYDKANRTFHACLSCFGRTINFGYVRTPLDCARAVDVMLITLGRPSVNFPDDTCGTASWRRNSDYKKRIAVKVEQLKTFLEEMKAKKKVAQTDAFVPEGGGGGFHANSQKQSENGNGKRPGDAHKEKDSGNPQERVEGDDALPNANGMPAQGGGGGDAGNLQNLANAANGGEDDGAHVLAKGDAMSFKKRIIKIKPQTPMDASPARDCR